MSSQPPTYDPNVPENPSDSLASTQPEFLNNFLQLYNSFKTNHVPLDASSSAGNHTIVELTEQENTFQTDINEITVYSKDVSGQTDQLFLRYQGNGQEIQVTNYQIYPINTTNPPTQFFTFLPGKLIVYFGSVTPTGTSYVLNLTPPVAFNILSIDSCGIGTVPDIKSPVSLNAPENGFYKSVNFLFTASGTRFSYFIVANI